MLGMNTHITEDWTLILRQLYFVPTLRFLVLRQFCPRVVWWNRKVRAISNLRLLGAPKSIRSEGKIRLEVGLQWNCATAMFSSFVGDILRHVTNNCWREKGAPGIGLCALFNAKKNSEACLARCHFHSFFNVLFTSCSLFTNQTSNYLLNSTINHLRFGFPPNCPTFSFV